MPSKLNKRLNVDDDFCLKQERLKVPCPRHGIVKGVQTVDRRGYKHPVTGVEYAILNHYCSICGKHIAGQRWDIPKPKEKTKRWI